MTGVPVQSILSADPGLRRTYAAGRATIAVAAALAISYVIIREAGQSPVIAMVAVTVALQMSLRPTARLPVQVRTELLGWLVSSLALALGVVLLESRSASAVGFVAVMAAGTWASGHGPAGLTLGIVGFVSYLFTQFAHPDPSELPWLIGAATVGVLLASVVRHLVLPDRPRRILRWLLTALRDEARDLVGAADDAPGSRGGVGTHRKSAENVDAILLQLHDLLDAHPGLVRDERQFRRDLFAVVTLAHLLVLQAERVAEPHDAALLPPSAAPAARLEIYLSALEGAVAGIPPTRQGNREGALEGEQALQGIEDDEDEESAAPTAGDADAGWLVGHRRRAVQVAFAGALAVAAGMQLSPERWYWAPMTSFFVFANVSSRGATLRKAVERTLGTVGGVAGGLLLGSVLAGHTRLQLIAVFPLLFLGFWLLPVSYALMTVAITTLLALLYSLMAMLTLDLLLLRLGETAIGAAIGVLVAYFLVPARTRNAIDEALREFLLSMDALLEALPAATERTGETDARVLRTVRRLDRATAALVSTVNPVSEAVPGRRARALRQELILALTARYWANRISARVLFQQHVPQDFRNFGSYVAGVRRRIENLLRDGAPLERPRRPDPAGDPLEAAVLRLETVLAALTRVRAQRD